MKKLNYCQGCLGYGYCSSCTVKPVIEEIIVCDTCGESLEMADIKLIVPIKLNYMFTDYDFCGLKCLFKFIAAENAKESK